MSAKAVRPGRFLSFEGIEGAGKSTLMRAVSEALQARGQAVLETFEPGDSVLGRRLRELLLHGDAPVPRAELFLYLADRAEHVERSLRPALAEGVWVLCDRFTDATIAYQGYGRGLDLDAVRRACAFAAGLVPDRTWLVDVPVNIGLERAGRRGAVDRMERESVAFHERVRAGYLALAAAEPARIRVLDGREPPGDLQTQVLQQLADL